MNQNTQTLIHDLKAKSKAFPCPKCRKPIGGPKDYFEKTVKGRTPCRNFICAAVVIWRGEIDELINQLTVSQEQVEKTK